MTGEDERQVGQLDAVSVVHYADELNPALLELDVDPSRPRIHRVLEQLLDDAGRPLDHLSGSDLRDDGRRQLVNARHRAGCPDYSSSAPWPSFLSFRSRASADMPRDFAAAATLPSAAARASLIRSWSFQSWICR